MSTFTKIATALVLATSIAGCVQAPSPAVQSTAAGAAIGATAGAIIGGSASDVAAGAIVGGAAGAIAAAQ